MNQSDRDLHRLSKDEYFLEMASVAAKRATCSRRSVGCILVDENDYIIGTGYNGTPHLAPHCLDNPCPGIAHGSGLGLDDCHSIHAEQNAVAHCSDPMKIDRVYLTVSPCMSCMKLLLATSAQWIIFKELYSRDALDFWRDNGRDFLVK